MYTENYLINTVDQLIQKCYVSTPDQIARIEKTLREIGLTQLADIVQDQGWNNCGPDYAEYQNQVAYETVKL